MTPLEALADVERFMEAASPDYARGDRPDIADAMRLIDKTLEDAASHDCDDILEWGEACRERLANDESIQQQLANEGVMGAIDETAIEVATRLGIGRHHGNPHCIWCLQGD